MRSSLLAVALVLCSIPLAEVAEAGPRHTVIETKNGQTYKGKVVKENKDKVVIEVRRGKISAEITIPRSEITKRLWDYIKKNGLQDQENKRNINADDALRVVFDGKDQVSMFEMTKLVSGHIKKI